MSILTRDMLASAASSPHGLTVGTVADPIRLSWSEIHDQAKRMARSLTAKGIGRHSSVAVLATDAADVAPLAQAIWLRRAALTMLQQPTPRTDLAVWLADTVRAILMVHADLVVLGEPFLMAKDQLLAHNLAVCTIESLRGAEPIEPVDADEAEEADIAMRQLTSGSTGVPKAVEISHANIAANSVALRDVFDMDAEKDVMASWLPLSHDMGMIAFLQFPMQLGAEAVVVATEQFLRRPLIWAELISRHRVTITAGPNFAYSLLTRVLQKADPTDIDLSSLRFAANGAEPINHRDLANFAAVGARFGLRPSAPRPAYGLAEATLVVSAAAPQDQAIVDSVSRQAVTQAHRAQPVPDDSENAQHVVCLGSPVTGMDVRIARDGKAQGPREIGAIELRGPAVASGYLTPDGCFPLARQDGWFDTGDLGYLDEEGRIYVCGRTKDLIVLAGTNLYPHDIERAAETVDGVRKGCVIALRVDAEREGFAVLAEVHNADEEDVRLRISRDITARVNRQVGHAPREVRLFPAGTLPKTLSGKLRRNCARELLPRGTRRILDRGHVTGD
ncbi:putative ligase [Mycobacterium noviomagense]|uniref:Long-chain fatty acid--CoA ligase n=1 Tax=Mycobacterium noviomagense TaxID=459858 RepID=A0A7I7P9G9_9MYCO|nr:long-chain fatty acid--CoA ligase [Mycobacterium noviomagense]BBY05240.1 putative ligase [Mycobacterium noviomagense]